VVTHWHLGLDETSLLTSKPNIHRFNHVLNLNGHRICYCLTQCSWVSHEPSLNKYGSSKLSNPTFFNQAHVESKLIYVLQATKPNILRFSHVLSPSEHGPSEILNPTSLGHPRVSPSGHGSCKQLDPTPLSSATFKVQTIMGKTSCRTKHPWSAMC
jgi:hypothetical protein